MAAMICCAYCEQPATTKIVSSPDQVCLEHALEFWTGLLVYARDLSAQSADHERLCTCRSCKRLKAPYVRTIAVAAAGPSPPVHERFQIRLAS
jgi:hypothetical protein